MLNSLKLGLVMASLVVASFGFAGQAKTQPSKKDCCVACCSKGKCEKCAKDCKSCPACKNCKNCKEGKCKKGGDCCGKGGCCSAPKKKG